MILTAIPLVAVGGGPVDFAAEVIVYGAWLTAAATNVILYGLIGVLIEQFFPGRGKQAGQDWEELPTIRPEPS